MKLLKFLFGTQTLSFNTKYTIDEATDKLNDNLSHIWENLDTTCAMGKAKKNKVRIYWYKAYTRNSFRPIFKGKFKTVEGKTILEGKLSLPLIIKLILIIWFTFLISINLFINFQMITSKPINFSNVLIFNFFTFIMFIGAYTLVYIGAKSSKNSLKEISKFIRTNIVDIT